MLKQLIAVSIVALSLVLAACDTETPPTANLTPEDFITLGADHNDAMVHMIQSLDAMSKDERDRVLSNATAREQFVLSNLDPFLASRGYDPTPHGSIGLVTNKSQLDLSALSDGARNLVLQAIDVTESGEDAESVSADLSIIEDAAISASLNAGDLEAVLSVTAIGRASFEHWENEIGQSTGMNKQVPDCVKRIAGADALGGLFGFVTGLGGGAAVGAVRASAISYIEVAHLNLCEQG